MTNSYSDDGVRTRLILAALDELCDHGIADFSLRRVAIAAQVSCAAPYRHFKSKEEMIVETARYITSRWTLFAEEIIKVHGNTTEKALVELCTSATAFWISNGKFRSLLIPDPDSLIADEMKSFDLPILRCIEGCLSKKGAGENDIKKQTYCILALIYGAVMLVGSGRQAADEAVCTVRENISNILNVF